MEVHINVHSEILPKQLLYTPHTRKIPYLKLPMRFLLTKNLVLVNELHYLYVKPEVPLHLPIYVVLAD